MPFQYKLSDVIKNTTFGTISATVLERVKIAGQIYDDITPFDYFSFNIKGDQLTLITSANHDGTFFAKFDLAKGWGEKFVQFANKQYDENDGYCDFNFNNDSYEITNTQSQDDETVIEFYIQETSEYIDFDGLIQFFIDGITNR